MVFVIAEIGINHDGNEALCAQMIDIAAASGADAVKLQTVTADVSYHPDTASYRVFKDATLSRDANVRMMEHAKRAGVILFSTPGDPSALALLFELGVPAIKISSGLLTNLPLIEMAAGGGKPLILSTGMPRRAQVVESVAVARAAGRPELPLLHPLAHPLPAAPHPPHGYLGTARQLSVGYSDHHDGHRGAGGGCGGQADQLSLDVSARRNHAASVEPAGFRAMVGHPRDQAMLGTAEKAPVEAELALRMGAMQALSARAICRRDIGQLNDIFLMRFPWTVRRCRRRGWAT